MANIMDIIADETAGHSFKTYKYCFDKFEVPSLSYDDHREITWKEYGETEPIREFRNLKEKADKYIKEGYQPLFTYFLDGSRRTFKVDDIAYTEQIFPVIAGQIGVGCCKRINKFMQPELLHKKLIIALPSKANKDEWNKDCFWENLCNKINNKLNNPSFNIDTIKCYTFKNNEFENLENKGIAVIQDFMIENEISMVNELVKKNKINQDNYLLKDGSLEYRVDNLKKNSRERKTFRNTFNFVVGASKSFNPLNCKDRRGKNNSNRIAKLPLFCRTPVALYESLRNQGMQYAVWYVRIRDPKYTSNIFDGILKLEKILPVEDNAPYKKLDTDEVDMITANIINERNPVCYGNDARWANHLYPIYITENYIKSRYLSNAMFLNLF